MARKTFEEQYADAWNQDMVNLDKALASRDPTKGTKCMRCGTPLISKDGKPFKADHPLYCKPCWRKVPGASRDGAPFFDEETGEVFTGEQ